MMAIIDHIQCGRIIIFNTMIFKLRWAFCIDFNSDEQIIYKGIFGLRSLDKKTFLSFARIVDIFDYIDRPLTLNEKSKLKMAYRTGSLKESCRTVKEFVEKLYDVAEIKYFVNTENNGWTLNGTKRSDIEK